MHLEVFSIAPLLDENFFQKSFDRLPAEGLWAHRKKKSSARKKQRIAVLRYAAGLLARRAFFENESVFFRPFPGKRRKTGIADEKHFFKPFPQRDVRRLRLSDFLPQVSISRRKRRTAFISQNAAFRRGTGADPGAGSGNVYEDLGRKECYLKFTGRVYAFP